ncbi:MAG: helix-turn-helix transcriptional regulator, partial [Acidimicrobiales bacterium]
AFPWLGRGRLRHAELLHRTGRSDAAADKIASVLQTADHLGLKRLENEARAAQQQLGLPAGPVSVPGLTDRESALLAAVAEGSSNRELADRFCVSIKTVERHLSNVYTKLGVRRRADAVAAAFGDE